MPRDAKSIAMRISLGVSFLMLTGKATAWYLTHSVAILSDFAESLVHGVATGLAAFALWYAARPADAAHPYGHGRIAYFSAGFEGALVFSASVSIIVAGVHGLIEAPALRNLGVGLAISGGLAAINLVLGIALVRIGRAHNTLILVANGQHVLSDMWTTVASILGVALVLLTGVWWIDPTVAIGIGLYIMYTGVSLLRESYAGLMDEVSPAVVNKLIEGLSKAVDDGIIREFHQLRCRNVNEEVWIDVHLLAPGDLSLVDAHRRATLVEERLRGMFDHRLRITSHIEPSDHELAHPGGHRSNDPLADVRGSLEQTT
ncbi:MAG: cation transporter [Phycisphaerales bacterium]|nr:cation transporter [Phycisphaerales bacterium]